MFNLFSYCDVPVRWQLGIQDPATPQAEGMLYFNHYLIFFMIIIVTLVLWTLYSAFEPNRTVPAKFSHSSTLEIVWTIFPAVILLLIAVPSFSLLYSLEELSSPELTIKIVGHQWYWSYELSDYTEDNKSLNINYDSYMISTKDLEVGAYRLLETDYRLLIPVKTNLKLLITSADVLHSWAVPSFGIKVDACPGRVTQTSLYVKRTGVFYGQCSEICGIKHGFMPIVVSVLPKEYFNAWVQIQSYLDKSK